MESTPSILEDNLENRMSILEEKLEKIAVTLENFQTFVHREFTKLPTLIDSLIDARISAAGIVKGGKHEMDVLEEEDEQSVLGFNHSLRRNEEQGSYSQTTWSSRERYEANVSLKTKNTLQSEDLKFIAKSTEFIAIDNSKYKEKSSILESKSSRSREIQGSNPGEKSIPKPAVEDAQKVFEECPQSGMESCVLYDIVTIQQEGDMGFSPLTYDPGGHKYLGWPQISDIDVGCDSGVTSPEEFRDSRFLGNYNEVVLPLATVQSGVGSFACQIEHVGIFDVRGELCAGRVKRKKSGGDTYYARVTRLRGSGQNTSTAKEPIDAGKSSGTIMQYGSELIVYFGKPTQHPDYVGELTNLVNPFIVTNESCGARKMSYGGRIVRSRSSMEQSNHMNDILRLDGFSDDKKEDVENLLFRSPWIYTLFQKMLKKLSGSVLILGSQIILQNNDSSQLDKRPTAVFPYKLELQEDIFYIFFDRRSKEEIKFLINENEVGSTPEDIVVFIGDFHGEGEELSLKVMHAYVDSFEFQGMEFAYSVIMLNTDDHHHTMYYTISVDDFIRNNRGIDDGKDLEEEYCLRHTHKQFKEKACKSELDHGLSICIYWERELLQMPHFLVFYKMR